MIIGPVGGSKQVSNLCHLERSLFAKVEGIREVVCERAVRRLCVEQVEDYVVQGFS